MGVKENSGKDSKSEANFIPEIYVLSHYASPENHKLKSREWLREGN
jgi:hypothetical protein